MFGFESKDQGPLAGLSQELREAITEAGLENDSAVLNMVKSGFTAPNGTEYDPLEFIAQRKALVDAGEAGATTPNLTADSMVQHSPAPEEEPRAELN